MADRRGALIPLIILGYLIFSPDPTRSSANYAGRNHTLESVLAAERFLLNVQRNSSFESFDPKHGRFLNLTGLQPENGFAWDSLQLVKEKAHQYIERSLGQYGLGLLSEVPEALPDSPALWNNVSGYANGNWIRSKLQEHATIPNLNLSSFAPEGPFGPLAPRYFGRNITGERGDISFRFRERLSPSIVEYGAHSVSGVSAEIAIHDDENSINYELAAFGIYFIDFGQMILTTTSSKFAGIFALPHFALTGPTFESARTYLNQSIGRTITLQQEGEISTTNPWGPSANLQQDNPFASPECELVIYLQQTPLTSLNTADPRAYVSFLERELRISSGAFLPPMPDLNFAMVAFSPDCGFVIESRGPPDYPIQDGDHLSGPKIEVLYRKSRRHLFFFACAMATQFALLIRQMREASTPSIRSRLSFYTIVILALGDGFVTMLLLVTSIFIPSLWATLMGIAFLSFNSVSFFGMRFVMDIWNVQAPERERRARELAVAERQRQQQIEAAFERFRNERQARLADTPPSTTTDQANAAATQSESMSLPLPVIAPRPMDTGASPVFFMPSDQAGLESAEVPTTATQNATVPVTTSSFGALYTRFYLFLLASLFISLHATSWPTELRRIYFTSLALCYLSFWTPQIARNVQRNCRRALKWEFVVGQSVLRLVPFTYFYGYADNVLFADVDYYSLILLVGWVWIQVVLLVSQELVGPRWFIRQDWAPPAYDYHPILRDDEEGANMPVGFSELQRTSTTSEPTSPSIERRGSIAKEIKDRGKRSYDCAICMQELEVPVIEPNGSSETTVGLLARRTYMVTPCRHVFHSTCLEGWMKYRLQCPICRETLPPL